MPKYEKYYVVEFRFPIKIDTADSVLHAVSKAARMCERIHGFRPESWFARVFEYDTGENKPGLSKEYFYNPNNSTHREIKKNIGYHQDMVLQGRSPDDVSDNDFYESEDYENLSED